MVSRSRLSYCLVISLLLLLASVVADAGISSATDTSTIVVVGTVHAATKYYDQSVLGKIIEKVSPDIILVELDSSFFGSSMLLKPEFVSISLENKAVAAYCRSHSVRVYPYDIEGRNAMYERYDYFRLQREMSAALDSVETMNLLGSKEVVLLEAVRRFDMIGSAFRSERPEVINSAACDAAMESKQYFGGEGITQIASAVPALARYVDFCKFRRDFWIQRNDVMVEKIEGWAKQFAGRTILVLCGYEHRYYLRTGIAKRIEGRPILLKEYWEF